MGSPALTALATLATSPDSRKTVALGDACEQAWPFLGALAARQFRSGGTSGRVWFVCPDVRSQEDFASELSAWLASAGLFPDLEIPAAGLGLPDP